MAEQTRLVTAQENIKFATNMVMPEILRYMFMYLIIPITYLGSTLIVVSLQAILYISVKPFSKYVYRKINYYLCYANYAHLCFYFSWYNDSDCYVYMNKNIDNYIGKEHAYIIYNHRYEIDWCIVGNILNHFHCLGNCKGYLKNVLKYFPLIGWNCFFAENIFLQRSFDKDRRIINKQVRELVNYPDPMWLFLCPEGTRFTPDKHRYSLQYAREKGLPEFKHHLTPRTKGFVTSLAVMKGKMGAIYDITLTFDPQAVEPTFLNMLRGHKIDAHFYIKRIPLETVPEDEQGASQFLYDLFEEKDKLQESFFNTGKYCSESDTERAEKIKISPCYKLAIITAMWYSLIIVPLIYYIVKLLLTANMYSLSIILGVILLFSLMFSTMLRMNVKKSSYAIASK
ncbi:1-Acylglycerol-3-phosphate O-acyltransferase 3 [Carabus blaptoides fortunei]